MIMHCIPLALSQCFMHLDVYLIIENCVLVGLDWASTHGAIIFSTSHVHAYFMHTLSFLPIFLDSDCVLSLSLSQIDCSWHPSANLIQLGTFFFLGFLLLLLLFPLFTFGSVMRRLIEFSFEWVPRKHYMKYRMK